MCNSWYETYKIYHKFGVIYQVIDMDGDIVGFYRAKDKAFNGMVKDFMEIISQDPKSMIEYYEIGDRVDVSKYPSQEFHKQIVDTLRSLMTCDGSTCYVTFGEEAFYIIESYKVLNE